MSLLALIGGAISAAAAIIGPVLTSTATFIVTKLPPILETAAVCIKAISTIVTAVSELLEIAPPGENPEELGAKVLQEGTRPKGQTETTQEYLDYLRNEVVLDKEKFDKMTDEEKLNCAVMGDVMLTKSIEEKTGVEIPAEFLLTIPQANLQAQTVLALIKSFSNAGIPSLNEYTRYVANDMTEDEAEVVDVAVSDAIKECSPEMSEEDIQHEIIAMKREYNTEKF